MAKKQAQDPGRRLFFEEILEGVSGFFRELSREARAPSAREQELAAIHAELDEMEGTVQGILEQEASAQDILQRLERQQSLMLERLEAMERYLTPQEIPRWKKALDRLKWLLLPVAGATGGALYEALVQEEVYPELRGKLQQLVDRIDQVVLERFGPPISTDESTPEPTQPPTTTKPATGLEPELILIPAGTFLMGSDKRHDPMAYDDELPQHQVYVGKFYIAKYPVTNAEYRRFVDATGHRLPRHWTSLEERDQRFRVDDQPVVYVDWHDANTYCQWLSRATGKSYRLPTAAEWEKAARGTDGRRYPWGDQEPTPELCNFGGNAGHTTPVGRYSPRGDSPYGCSDMAGNVWEWCHSLYKSYPYDERDGREDPAAGGSRVLRGGSWDSDRRDTRVSDRGSGGPEYFMNYVGFRVVVAPVPSS